MLKLRSTRRAIARTAATVALAGGATIGLGTTAAHADSSTWYYTDYGTTVYLHFAVDSTPGYATLSWNIDTSRSTTDERIYFAILSNCGNSEQSVNDYQGPDSSSMTVRCFAGGFSGLSLSTESGVQSSPRIRLY